MNYIDVVSKFSYPNSKFDFFSLIIDLSDGVLVSLIEICRKKGVDDFHFDADKVLDFSVNYLDNHRKELWIDSGGFNLLSKYKLSEELLSVYMDKYFD